VRKGENKYNNNNIGLKTWAFAIWGCLSIFNHFSFCLIHFPLCAIIKNYEGFIPLLAVRLV
jgi:hypothetical protein